jgi:copper resistance protein B
METMKKKVFVLAAALLASPAVFAGGMEDDPLLFKLMLDQLEWRDADGDDLFVWEADAWIGRDLNKLWFKSEGERAGSVTEGAEIQALYSRAVDPYWDFQIGWRHDLKPEPNRDWLAVGFKGLAPYWFEVDATVFAGGNGQVAGRLQAEYEFMLTQRWVLSPEFEMNIHGKDDEQTGIGSGISDLELGLRLRYEIRREFAPYIGINWEKKFGKTAGFAEDEGESTDELQFVVGIRAWF